MELFFSSPINPDSAELRKPTSFIAKIPTIAPFTIFNTDPVWLFVLACTANAPIVHYFKVFVLSASNFNTLFIVYFKKLATRNNFFQPPYLATIESQGYKFNWLVYFGSCPISPQKKCDVSVKYAAPLFVKLLSVFLEFSEIFCPWYSFGCFDIVRGLF